MTILSESLNYLDMENQVIPVVSVDEYAAKMGTDKDIVTVTFMVKSKLVAEDLVTWFERGYDQALYLPILFLARKSKYLNEICYLYRINSNSLKVRSWKEKNQLDTIKLVRARGFVL